MALDHLLPTTRQIAAQDDAVRLEYLHSQRWVSYERAEQILERMDDLLKHPTVPRMPGMLVVGRSNNGKTSLIQHFLNSHPGEDNPNGPNIIAPVLAIETPPKPSDSAVYDAILYALCRRPRPNQLTNEKQRYILELLQQVRVKVLVVDEINNVLAGSVGSQRVFLNTLKFLSNSCQLSIVATGTPEALRVVQTDPQMASRLPPEPLPLWNCDMEYRSLLASFEQLLPLRERSHLSTKAMATLIHARTDGTIGSTAELVNAAAAWAISRGQEKIDEHAVAACPYRSPAERKKLTERV